MPQIKKLSCFDFRNYKTCSFEFKEKLVVFCGGNGRGKTNLLEALAILSTGKSWRESRGSDLIRDEEASAKIECVLGEDTYHAIIEPKSRSFWRNGKKTSLVKHIGKIPTLLFCPEHLHLFIGNKGERLKFFDRFLVQTHPLYRELLLRANRAHKQKNALLKGTEHPQSIPDLIAPWNKILAETLPQIIITRKDFLKDLIPDLQKHFSEISQNTNPISVSFAIAPPIEIDKKSFLAFFHKELPREIITKRNSLSPTSGDFLFLLRGKKLTQTASRGETRSALLALLSAKKEYLQKKLGQSPILLLDDVFSELDDNRQKHLEKLCQNSQAFFTTTHEEHFQNFIAKTQSIPI